MTHSLSLKIKRILCFNYHPIVKRPTQECFGTLVTVQETTKGLWCNSLMLMSVVALCVYACSLINAQPLWFRTGGKLRFLPAHRPTEKLGEGGSLPSYSLVPRIDRKRQDMTQLPRCIKLESESTGKLYYKQRICM